MGQTRVVFGEVGNVGADLVAEANKVQAILDEMNGDLQKTMGAWEGEASESYRHAQTEWQQAVESMRALLAGIGNTTVQNNQEYMDAAQRGANRFRG